MAKTYRQTLGSWGEALAASYLQERGYAILGRNVRTAYGEIDLIASPVQADLMANSHQAEDHSQVIVFVEVKTRTSLAYGQPEESVTPRKKAHLLAAAQAYMQSHADLSSAWRVDVIAVRCAKSGEAQEITHFENAFC
jgi:putative endonuclease